MARFSANVGFLWPELDLPMRILAASAAGFEAVECHFPYEYSPESIAIVLKDTGLPMLGLNTRLGVNGAEDFGVAARPDRVDEARAAIDEAIDYAAIIGCHNVNVVPGRTSRATGSEEVFCANLDYACERAANAGIGILIEPINTRTAPDFHMSTTDQALDTIETVGRDNLRLMFDCFHVQIMQGDLYHHLVQALPHTGHVQISAVHDRGEPGTGEIDYRWLLRALDGLGWNGYVGAEYKPRGTTDEGLDWMQSYCR